MGLKERKQREREERKRLILNATRELLFEKGLTAASINQIAKRAEIGVGTIYFYYRNKEELFATLQEEGLQLLHQKIMEAGSRTDGAPQRLTGMAQAYLDFSEHHKRYFDIISYFLSQPEVMFSVEVKRKVDRQGDRIIADVEAVIRTGLEDGSFRNVEPRKSAIMFWATLHGLVQMKKMQETILANDDYDVMFRYAVQQFIAGLTAPLDNIGQMPE